jgi:DNA invertase Pin-like site-specific DNA recombinase
MPSTTNFLDEAVDLVKKRLAELDDERKRLERALGELGDRVIGRPGRPPGRPRGSANKTAAPRRRRRKGGRAGQALKLVNANPGITASEIAKQLKIKPNYVYSVLGNLEKEKQVTKKDRKYFPVG